MDDLSIALQRTGIGAQIGNVNCNHIFYADDTCIITTTLNSMHRLLTICSEYASNHNLKFNPQKTEFQGFLPSYANKTIDLYIDFQGFRVTHNNFVKYLGYTVGSQKTKKCSMFNDSLEMKKRIAEMYTRSHMLRTYFMNCSVSVKKNFYNSYLSTVYCCSLWNITLNRTSKKKVAHNDALRILFGIPRYTSASEAFVTRGIDNIDSIIRKSVFSLLTRISLSKNDILNTIYNNKFKFCPVSSLAKLWVKVLYVNPDINI